jgi:hypothetical protein
MVHPQHPDDPISVSPAFSTWQQQQQLLMLQES